MAILAALALALLLPGIQTSLFDRDEGWYAQVSREMLATGDWLVPRYLGEVWLAKPPLLYWLVAGSFRVLGIGEWQARLAPVAFSVVNVVLAAMLGAQLFGRRTGIWAGVLFATSSLPAFVGKMVLTDPPMLSCTLAALLLHGQMAEGGVRHVRAAAYWLCIAMGVLAKGPAILLFAGAFAIALLVSGKRGWIRHPRFWLWLPLGIAVAAPWYVYIGRHAGGTFTEQFLWYEIGSRLASEHRHAAPPGYYLLVSLAGLLPWTVFVPGAVIEAVRDAREERRLRLVLVWLALPWIVLEIVRSKLPHYVAPCYVPLAILLARQLANATRDRRRLGMLMPGERKVLMLWPAVLIGIGGIVAGAAFAWAGPGWTLAALGTGATLVIGFAVVRALLIRYGLRPAVIGTVASIVVFYAVVGLWLLPALEPLRLSRRLADTINQSVSRGESVYLCGYEEPTTFFYIRGTARPLAPDGLELALRERSLVAVTGEILEDLAPAFRQRLDTIAMVEGYNYVRMQHVTVHLVRARPAPQARGASPGGNPCAAGSS